MRQYLLDLYEIQKIDLAIREQQKRQEAIPGALRALETNATTLQQRLAALREQHQRSLDDAQKLRHLIDEEVHKIRKWESRLNDIRNQREYQALSRETEGSKRANRDAEEKLGELMKLTETLEAEIATAEAELADVEGRCSVERGQVEEAVKTLSEAMAREGKRRDALIPRVPKALFHKYDAIRSRRFGMGLSMVVAGCCQGCNMRLPPQLYNILQRGDSIEQCPSCHRVIFWENILPAEPPAADAGSVHA